MLGRSLKARSHSNSDAEPVKRYMGTLTVITCTAQNNHGTMIDRSPESTHFFKMLRSTSNNCYSDQNATLQLQLAGYKSISSSNNIHLQLLM